jgi:hypothetical protein
MLNKITVLIAMAAALQAQQVVAPTTEPVGSARGDSIGDYNVTQSFEFGYRWNQTGGDLGMYRQVVNFRRGFRLLNSSLSVNSKDGHGRYFDEILLNTTGLGNDPYEAVSLRIQKNSLYRYDLSWRMNDYFNPGLTVADGLHLRNTSRRLQDHDLTLFPNPRAQFRLGYSRNVEDGPALTTSQEFDPNGSGLPVFMDVRRHWNEYRLGTDVEIAGFKLTLTRRWDFFKEDNAYSLTGTAAPRPPTTDLTELRQFARGEPIHGSNPGWLGNLFTRRKLWGVNARMTYVSGSRDFIQDEFSSGIGQFGGAANRVIVVGGNAKRPVAAGDFAISFFPTENLTVVNNTSVFSNRIDGNSSYSEVNTGFDLGTTINFRYIGIRTVANATDVNYRVNNRLGFFAGYRYSDRLIKTVDGFTNPQPGGGTDREAYQVSNHMNSGVAGVRLRPWKPFTLNLSGEVGRANYPLTPVSDRDYHAINGRADYRVRRLTLSANYHQVYNLNAPLTFSTFDSHSRQYGANASWAPKDWFSIDASYMKLHLDTRGGIAFFASTTTRPQLVSAFPSYFRSNIHAANLGSRFSVKKRADVYVGYAITKDVGDGRATAVPTGVVDPIESLLASVQTFPLTYQSPLARLSIRLKSKLRWNAGYQYYSYNEQFHILGALQNFRAHTGYTSLLWAF